MPKNIKSVLLPLLFLVISVFASFFIAKNYNKFQVSTHKAASFSRLIGIQTHESKQTEQNPPSSEEPKPPVDEDAGKYCLFVPILLYHHIQPTDRAKKYNQEYLTVEPKTFEEHLDYLTTHGYRTISTQTLIEALKNHGSVPNQSIIITLDDGYSDAHEFAYPLAKKYKVDLNVMIPVGFIGQGGYMTWENLEEMVKSKRIKVFPHGYSHAALTYQSNDSINYEVSESKKQVEKHLGGFYPVFSYPMGFFDDRVINILKQNHYVGAFSTLEGSKQCDQNEYKLRRIRIGNINIESYGF